MIKRAEPPPPKGVSSKEWDKILNRKEKRSFYGSLYPNKGEKISGYGDVEDLESGDPTRLMPRLRQIHKMGEAGLPPVEAYVTGPSAAGKTTFVKGQFPASQFHHLQADRYRKIKDTPTGRRRSFDWPQAIKDARASGKPVVVDSLDIHKPLAEAARLKIRMATSKAEVERRHQARGKGHPGGATRAFDYFHTEVLPVADRLGFLEKKGYKLQGHTDFQGLPIAIENRRGSVRKGKSREGVEWRTKMKHPYGYIVGTKGKDDEAVDCYVGPDKEAPAAFVVHQHKPDGTGYDEDKVMLGFPSKKAAKEAFLMHYDSPKFLGPMAKVSMERLRELVASKKRLVKISSVQGRALLEELMSIQKVAQEAPQPPKKRSLGQLVRKAGPGVGGLIGAGVGALVGARRGKLLKGTLAGLGTGATLGWIPDMAGNVRESISRYRSGK